MRLADLHADTPYRIYKEGLPFTSPALHVSQDGLCRYASVRAVFAFFSDPSLPDEALFSEFFKTKACFEHALSACRLPDDFGMIYALEDARMLDSNETRLLPLYEAGIRIITPLWGGHTCIGGAFDTQTGLTDFGKRAVNLALHLGMIPDISHASRRSADDIFDLASQAKMPVLATHSNAYGVFAHPRNLSDSQLSSVIDSGGLVGISLAPQHLCAGGASMSDVLRHIDYYLTHGAQAVLSLGCDFDGIEHTPKDLTSIGDLPILYAEITRLYGEHVAERIFYENAASFFERVL